MERHFTATAFVVQEGKVLLHWHRKAQMWLPPGGHLLRDEDPLEAALREVAEETGLSVEVLANCETFAFAYPEQAPSPVTILIENSFDREGQHKHIDFIYFCRPVSGSNAAPQQPDDILAWVEEAVLALDEAVDFAGCGICVPISEDVRILALKAIEFERSIDHVTPA